MNLTLKRHLLKDDVLNPYGRFMGIQNKNHGKTTYHCLSEDYISEFDGVFFDNSWDMGCFG